MSAERLREAANLLRKNGERAAALDWEAVENLARIGVTSSVIALPLADWLDATAGRIDAGRDWIDGGKRNHGWRGTKQALAVAEAILGGESA